MTTGFVFDPYFLQHDPGAGHPERSARLDATINHLRTQAWFDALHPVHAAPAELDALGRIHAGDYIERAKEACERGDRHLDVPDVGICPDSFDVARLAAGAAIALGDGVMSGQYRNGFSLTRPPGHHAEQALALGFCLFNNIAVLARHLQAVHGVDKVAILDWDVHHGNGTQHAFYDRDDVLVISLHRYDGGAFYPCKEDANYTYTGDGAGAFHNINISWNPKLFDSQRSRMGDADYLT